MERHQIRRSLGATLFSALALARAAPSAAPEPPRRFASVLVDPAGSAPRDPWCKAVGDLNGDGRPDLIAGGHSGGGLFWYENTGRPDRWRKREIAPGAGFGTDAEVADIDGDRDPDIVAIRGEAVVWYENPGWKAREIGRAPLHDIEVADFDGDGKLDVLGRNQGEFGGSGRELRLFRQLSASEWASSSREVLDGEGLLVRDVDGDGRPDGILNGRWYENRGPLAEWAEFTFAPSWTHKSAFVAAGDIDRDGREDIVLAPSELQGRRYRLSWFRRPEDPRSAWEERVVLADVEAVHHFVGVADFEGDRSLDIATAEMHQGADPDLISILFNAGSGRSWTRLDLAATGSHSMRIADLDADGLPDLYGANHSSSAPNGAPLEIWITAR